jgi:hypothetical protein
LPEPAPEECILAQKISSPFLLPLMMTELAVASWETVWHRTTLMMTGACSPAEYQRMMSEKMLAMQLAGAAMMAGEDVEAVIKPFHKRATANAKRLRG